MSTVYDRTAWQVPEQPRDVSGRFGEKRCSLPEVALADDDTIRPGDRVSYQGGPAHRVTSIAGPTYILRNLAGGSVVANAGQLTKLKESPAQRERNLGLESTLGGMRASLKGASRQQKERLDVPGDRAAMEQAQDRVIRAVLGGHVDHDLWRMGDALSKDQPLGARNAIAAVVARERLTPSEFQVLTDSWTRVLGPLPR